MKRGVVIGKFYPPHKGHSHLITTAQKNVDQLTVIVCDKKGQVIPGEKRAGWIREIHPRATVITVDDNLPDDDSKGWAAYTVKTLGYKPDVVFTSEDYGTPYAKYMNAEHVMVDKKRSQIPISATQIRTDPFSYWEYLEGPVKSFFTKRIVLVGAESTGKTTLAKKLADHFRTNWVPEFGRMYSEKYNKIAAGATWNTDEFVLIAKQQNKTEDHLAKSSEKIIFCDTDSFCTALWHERYMASWSNEVEELSKGRFYDHTLLLDVDAPFVQDGTRDGEHIRSKMHQRFIEQLEKCRRRYSLLSGDFEEKTEKAIRICEQVMKENRWANEKW